MKTDKKIVYFVLLIVSEVVLPKRKIIVPRHLFETFREFLKSSLLAFGHAFAYLFLTVSDSAAFTLVYSLGLNYLGFCLLI